MPIRVSVCLSVCLSVLFTTPIWIAYGWMHRLHTHESIGLRGCGCVVRVCVWFCLFVIIFTQFNCTRKTPTISAFCGIQVTSIQAVVNSALKNHQESNNIDFVREKERGPIIIFSSTIITIFQISITIVSLYQMEEAFVTP